jgi:integrase
LLTGARRANVLAMKWQEIDFDRAEWHIARTKNGEPQTVPLIPEAVALLRGRHRQDDDVFVFAGSGSRGHLVEPKSGWRRIMDRDEVTQLKARLEAAGKPLQDRPNEPLSESLVRARREALAIKIDPSTLRMADLRIHDLRRTLGSWQARTGASLAIIGKSLNHKSVQTTAIYSRLDMDPVRASIERATSAMFFAAGVQPAPKAPTS